MKYLRLLRYYSITKLVSSRWVLGFVILSFYPLFCLNRLEQIAAVTNTRVNVLDIIFYEFGLYTNAFLVLFPLYFILISDIYHHRGMENYFFLRLKTRRSWITMKILLSFVATFVYFVLSVSLCLFVGAFSLERSVSFSDTLYDPQSFANASYFNYEFVKLEPALVVCAVLGLFFLALLTCGLFILYLNMYFKKAVMPFFIIIIINFVGLILLKTNHMFDSGFLFPYKRIFLQYQSPILNIKDVSGVGFSIIYWGIIIAIMLFSIIRKAKFMDFLEGDAENEK